MGEMTLLERIREWIGDAAFLVFLWSRGWTEEQYIELVRKKS